MPVVVETNLFEIDPDTGESTQLSSVSRYKGSQLGDDYVVVYKKALNKLLSKNASYSVLRVFLKLMSLQTFGSKIVITNKYLYEQLGICRNAYFKALKWLIDNGFVIKSDVNGMNAFVLNPDVTACGTSALKERRALWSAKFITDVDGFIHLDSGNGNKRANEDNKKGKKQEAN